MGLKPIAMHMQVIHFNKWITRITKKYQNTDNKIIRNKSGSLWITLIRQNVFV